MKILKRKFYLQKIENLIGNNELIKVIIGQRRVGKSYIMKQISEKIIENGTSQENIIFINLEKDYFKFPTIKKLKNFIDSKITNNKQYFLFIDEIQELENREKLINYYRSKGNIDIFISGSNSKLLSGELATYLTGRYIKFEIFPFSYGEFLEYFEIENNIENFLKYMKLGGLSQIYILPNDEIISNFLESLKETILMKDLIQRFKIKDADTLEKLTNFLINNIGNKFSTNKIVNTLKSKGINTNVVTINNYLQYLKQSFLFHEAKIYDIQGKRLFETNEKFYLNDITFYNFLNSDFEVGKGKLLENLVFIHLKRLGYKVYVGKLKNLEIDFIAEKGNKKIYIQVAYLIANEDVRQREFGNLLKIQDNHPKLVLSMDPITQNYKGIEHMKIYEFLENE